MNELLTFLRSSNIPVKSITRIEIEDENQTCELCKFLDGMTFDVSDKKNIDRFIRDVHPNDGWTYSINYESDVPITYKEPPSELMKMHYHPLDSISPLDYNTIVRTNEEIINNESVERLSPKELTIFTNTLIQQTKKATQIIDKTNYKEYGKYGFNADVIKNGEMYDYINAKLRSLMSQGAFKDKNKIQIKQIFKKSIYWASTKRKYDLADNMLEIFLNKTKLIDYYYKLEGVRY